MASPVYRAHVESGAEEFPLADNAHIYYRGVQCIAHWLQAACASPEVPEVPEVPQFPTLAPALQLLITASALGMSKYFTPIEQAYCEVIGTHSPSIDEVSTVTTYGRQHLEYGIESIVKALYGRLSQIASFENDGDECQEAYGSFLEQFKAYDTLQQTAEVQEDPATMTVADAGKKKKNKHSNRKKRTST